MRMRTILVLILGLGAACGTKPNPDVCCTDVDQCAAIGVSDGLRPCSGAGQVCTPAGVCVASECDVNTDCTDAASPICIAHACVAKCVMDTDCMAPAAAKCDSDGVCVACLENAQCTTETAPICDATAHACRGCTEDTECSTGVCVEALGTCAVATQIIFVSAEGTSNATCDLAHPCLTVADAIRVLTPTRNVVRIVGDLVTTSTSSIRLNENTIVFDGNGTRLTGPSPLFVIGGGATVVMEGLATTGQSPGGLVFAQVTGGSLTASSLSLTTAAIDVTGGAVHIARSTFDWSANRGDGVTCEGGDLTLETSSFTTASVFVSGGTARIARNKFDMRQDGSVGAGTALVTIENNVIVSHSQFADSMSAQSLEAGSTVRFNTFFNASGVTDGGRALRCDATVAVSSNIFAWNSTQSPTCLTTHSLFDQFTSQLGEGNSSAAVGTFFADASTLDLHLSAASPARGGGEAGLPVTTDFDGSARPNPAGSAPDVGAFEAP